jgi:hypothetical protein
MSPGVRGLALLAITGVVGLILAVHGWSARRSGFVASMAGGLSAASPTPSTAGGGSAAGPSRPAPSPSASGGAGPLLGSEPYASYAFQVWPGTPSASAKQAMTGLTISATRQGHGITVKAGANGQPLAAHTYPNGARVYVVESSLGDDSGGSDYSLGDDGLVVTDATGRVVQ